MHGTGSGQPDAAGDQPLGRTTDTLLDAVYDELRGLARAYLRRGRPGTLQTTALVHEAYLRLSKRNGVRWDSRSHFLAVAARAMRQILSNYVRDRQAAKRGGGWRRISLDEVSATQRDLEIDLVVLDDALERLAALDRRQSRIVDCRLFSGMTMDEIAEVLGVSTSTVEREWRAARAWLSVQLEEAETR